MGIDPADENRPCDEGLRAGGLARGRGKVFYINCRYGVEMRGEEDAGASGVMAGGS